jgi:hypothetical protein
MTNRSKLNRWIELNNDNVYKGPRGPAYFKVHVVGDKQVEVRSTRIVPEVLSIMLY